MSLILLSIFAVLLALGAPIAVCLGLSAALVIVIEGLATCLSLVDLETDRGGLQLVKRLEDSAPPPVAALINHTSR